MADNVFLEAGTTIDQTATGVITASTLLVMAGDNVTLDDDNVVDNFAATLTTGNLLFKSVNDLTIVNDSIDGMPVNGVGAPGFAKLISEGSLNLTALVGASEVFLMAGTTIDQDAAGIITATTLLVMAGDDVTLNEPTNKVRYIAAHITEGSFRFESTEAITIASREIDGMRIQGITIIDDGIFSDLKLDIKSTGGNIEQEMIDPDTNPAVNRAPIKVEVASATFSVPDAASILLSDILTDVGSINEAAHRSATENRFFVDTDDILLETELSFVTNDPMDQIEDLTIVDDTLVELKNIDIGGDLIVIGGRTMDTMTRGPDMEFFSQGEAIIQDGAVVVAGKAQFHAIEGMAGDKSILLDNLQILGVDQTTRDTVGNLAVTTIGMTGDVGGDALIINNIQVAFRSDVNTDVEGDLKAVATTGDITDAANFVPDEYAIITIDGNATFKAKDGDIILANENDADNKLTVLGRASFITVTQGTVDVGVLADGTFADAVVELGTLIQYRQRRRYLHVWPGTSRGG